MAVGDLLYGGGDAGGITDVQLDRLHRQAFGLQLQRFCHGGVALAAGQQRVHAGLGQLAHGFQADATGGTGDQGDLGSSGIHG
ncbi:hypothetical protein D9M71_787270 [compost metagenome]